MNIGGGFDFEGGKWEAWIKGTPKKIKRTKETTIRVGLEKKRKMKKRPSPSSFYWNAGCSKVILESIYLNLVI